MNRRFLKNTFILLAVTLILAATAEHDGVSTAGVGMLYGLRCFGYFRAWNANGRK